MQPVLSVLIAALDSRKNTMLESLLKDNSLELHVDDTLLLNPIVVYKGIVSELPVEVLIFPDNGKLSSGSKRQTLLNLSKGIYVCFADDDDTVHPHYLSNILHACKYNHADVITFNLDFYRNGKHEEVWQFGLHRNHRALGLMCLNHLCVWTRFLAKQVAWCPALGYGDDRLWFEPLAFSGKIKTVYHIAKPLYNYYYTDAGTANQKRAVVEFGRQYMKPGIKCYLNNKEEIFIEVPTEYKVPGIITVRDCNNKHHDLRLSDPNFYHYYTVR